VRLLSAFQLSTWQKNVFVSWERKFRRQAEGPDASLFGELAGGPSGGGHNSRPPPVRASCSLCLKQFPSSAAACFRQPLPLPFGQRRRLFSAPKPFSKVRLPAAFLQLSSVRRGPVFDRYGRRNRRGGEPVPGNGYSAAPIGQNRDSVPGNGYSAAPIGQNRDSVPGNGYSAAPTGQNRDSVPGNGYSAAPIGQNRDSVPGNGYSAAPTGQNRDSVPGNGYSAAPTNQNRDSVPGNGLLRTRKRLKTCRRRQKTAARARKPQKSCRRKRKTEARGCFCYAAEQKKRK